MYVQFNTATAIYNFACTCQLANTLQRIGRDISSLFFAGIRINHYGYFMPKVNSG